MNRLILALTTALTCMSAMVLAYQSPNRLNPNREYEVVAINDLTEDMLDTLFSSKSPQYILECTEGAVLPFRISLKGEFLALEDAADSLRTIKVLKTCYITHEDGKFLFSLDLKSWKTFDKLFKGQIGAAVVVENEPIVEFNIELNQK